MSARAPLQLGILISGRGSNMTAIVRAALAGEIAVHPAIVIADRAAAGDEDSELQRRAGAHSWVTTPRSPLRTSPMT